ncbi:MAG: hypothetical protein L0332_09985 [Chloroflexi bacterium]|nr:hypothetical protein [Chloroflexota bacterium]MCI0578878.1 hypothetical protein [Chloroflexota bacterium]MCI0649119.1 hypothetical protein [Chloroflexota bacterium]MCI0727034.1 hypothetical protein [Chloroflexota bacterium]
MSTRRLFVILLAIALFAMSVRETIDPDLWWHLATGRVILEQGLPETDLFSYTVRDHEWIVQEWLTDVLMYLVYLVAGLPGLSLFFAALVAVAFLLVYARCAGRPYLAAFVVLLAVLAAALPLGARPQMFNLFFLAMFIYILEGYKAGRLGRRTLYLLPLLAILWANMHSGYLAGVALLAVYTVGEGAQRLFARRPEQALPWPEVGRLGAITLASLLAALLNPHGYKLLLFPLGTLGSQAIQGNILEWRSPDFHQPYFWFFGLLMAAGVASWLFSRQRPGWTEALLFLGTAAAGLLSARHIPLFAVAAPPIISRHLLSALDGTALYPLLSGQQPPARPPRLAAAVNWLLVALVLLVTGVWVAGRLANNNLAVAARFPVAAVDYLESSGLVSARLYNHYDWGGYLIWRGVPVFVDGRTELYGNEFFLRYLQTFELRENWRDPLEEYSVEVILVPRSLALATLLQAGDGWREVYADDLAKVFVRRDERLEIRD